MKTILTTLLAVLITGIAYAGKYEEAMQKALNQLGEARETQSFVNTAQSFERIAKKEQEKWLPQYYASFCYIQASFTHKDPATKDQYLDQAQSYLDAGLKVEDNSELQTLQGYLSMAKLTVDPMSRGQQLTPVIMQTLGKAIQMDPENPRAHYVMAQMQMGTARFFGKGEKEACQVAMTAHQKYEAAENNDPFMPTWGANSAKEMAESCNSTSTDND